MVESIQHILDLIRSVPVMLEEDRVIMLFIDGLGINNLRLPFLKRFTCQTIFPSSTPTFFYSFHSLLQPAEHGFLEWNMRFGKKIITIPPWIDIKGREVKASSRTIFPFIPLSEMLHRKGFTSTYYSPFADTPFSRASGRKARHVKISLLADVFPLADSDFVFIYWPSIDTILHERFKDERFDVEIRMIETFISLLWKRLVNGKIFVLSDHGLTDVKRKYLLPGIGGMPVGGARVAFYKNIEKEEVERVFRRKRIPADIYYLKEAPYFNGKISRRCYKNYGNVIAIAKDKIGFIYPYSNEKYRGAHGGLSREEMHVNVWHGEK